MAQLRTLPAFRGFGDPVELRPNSHPTMPKVVVRDGLGKIIEDTHYNPAEGIVIALDDLPNVGQVAIIPPGGTVSLIVPQGRT